MIGNSTRVPPTPLIPMHAEKSHLLNWMEGKWSRYGRSSPAAPLAERSPGSRACIFLVVPANRSDHSRLQVSGYAQSDVGTTVLQQLTTILAMMAIFKSEDRKRGEQTNRDVSLGSCPPQLATTWRLRAITPPTVACA